jgi:hypothetical protein
MDENKEDLVTCYPIIHNSVKIFATIIGKSKNLMEQEVSLKLHLD